MKSVQEIAVAKNALQQPEEYLAARCWSAELSPPCPEAARPAGGVGTLTRKPGTVHQPKPITEDYASALETGRIMITLVHVAGIFSFYILNI